MFMVSAWDEHSRVLNDPKVNKKMIFGYFVEVKGSKEFTRGSFDFCFRIGSAML